MQNLQQQALQRMQQHLEPGSNAAPQLVATGNDMASRRGMTVGVTAPASQEASEGDMADVNTTSADDSSEGRTDDTTPAHTEAGMLNPLQQQALKVMQWHMEEGGNGVQQMIDMGNAMAGRRVVVLKPHTSPQWMLAQIVRVTAQAMQVTYGGNMVDILTPTSENCVVRMPDEAMLDLPAKRQQQLLQNQRQQQEIQARKHHPLPMPDCCGASNAMTGRRDEGAPGGNMGGTPTPTIGNRREQRSDDTASSHPVAGTWQNPHQQQALQIMQQHLQQGGNGVRQMIAMGHTMVGRRVVVLKPYMNPQWMHAQIVQVTAQAMQVTYGADMVDFLTPSTENCVVRMLS